MYRKVFTILFVVIFCYASNILAQNNNTNFNLTNEVQPSPTVAALGKYADYPVSYYTGVPQISVPLYTLKDGAIELPISLSYHASGIKVSENASSVGLGWALNAGGMIARAVRGTPDEGTGQTAVNTIGLNGYYISYGVTNLPKLPYTNESPNAAQNYNSIFLPELARGVLDTEPDLFTFNFNGHTGKFVFDENRTARLLTDDNLKIEVVHSGLTFQYWKITTEDGLQYYFGEANNNDVLSSTSNVQDFVNTGKPSSWFLTRIVNPNTKETVTFTYDRESYQYFDLGPETALFSKGTDQPLEWACNLDIKLNMIKTQVDGVRLKSIQTKNYFIKFVNNIVREDLYGSARRLDSIKIYNGSNCLKQYSFMYNYFLSLPGAAPHIATYLSDKDNPNVDTKRLKLLSVTEIDGMGSMSKPPYTFLYNESKQLPRRLSFDQDYWGYSNKELNTAYQNEFFTPKVTSSYCSPAASSVFGANRESSYPAMSAFSLASIKNPLGATTIFTYEANRDGPVTNSGDVGIVGGLRIKQIQVKDTAGEVTGTRTFNYYDGGGILYRDPRYSFLIELQNEFYPEDSGPGVGGYVGYYNWKTPVNMLRQSESILPLQDPQGNHIGYPFVKESFDTTGERGYVVRHYQAIASINSESSRTDMEKYTGTGTILGITGRVGSGRYNEVQTDSLHYRSSSNGLPLFPLTPQQVDITRGNLLSVATYDANNHLLDSVTNVYGENYHENIKIRGFKTYNTQYKDGTNVGSVVVNRYALAFYRLHTGVSHLLSTTKINYRSGQPVTETTKYGYESPNHTLATSDTTSNSAGITFIGKHYYSFDYANGAAANNVFGKMKNRNLLLPVSTRKWRNGKLVGGTITSYKDFATTAPDTLINPEKVYNLESITPLTTAQAGENQSWIDQQSTLLPSTFYKEKANFVNDSNTGKSNQQTLTNSIPISYQWSYNDTYPVVKIINAANTYKRILTSTATTTGTGLTLLNGSTQTSSTQFTVQALGNTVVDISFHSNPGTNVLDQVSGLITGPSGYSSNFTLCLSNGSVSCGNYTASKSFANLAPGIYNISANFYQSQNVIADTYLTVSYPVFATAPSGTKEFYYEGFEENNDYNTKTGVAHTGSKYTIKDTLKWIRPNSRDYVISYWYRSGGNWMYKAPQAYTGSSFTFTGGDAYDDIRIYPKDAQMTTYTYDASVGMTSQTDAKGETTYYEYDSFQRLLNIKDQNGNILKSYQYNYHH
jgi:YD repeat-containing protein